MKQDSIQKLNANIEQLLSRDEKPFTLPQASEYLGVSKSHLYKLTYQNLIVHFKPNGKKIYFKRSDLDKYIFRNRKADQNELEQLAIDRVVSQ